MTTFADDFNRADSSNLGAGWVEVSGDWSIVSNQLSPGSLGGTIILRAATDTTTDDNFAQGTIAATTAASQGFVCRGNANFTNGYLWRNNGTSWDLFSIVGGSFTALATFAAAAAPGDVAKVEAIGSAIKAYVNGVERASVTNTDVITGKSTGIRAESVSGLRFDDFSSGDAGAATVTGSISQAFGSLGGGVTAVRDVPAAVTQNYGALGGGIAGDREVLATAAQAYGALAGGVIGTREVSAAVTQALGGLGAGVTATRETAGAIAFAGGALGGGISTAPSALKHASATLVALAWLETITGLPTGSNGKKQIATTLPPVERWKDTGFITVGPLFPGTPEMYVPLEHPIVQFDCWAVHRNSKAPNDGLANELAESIREAANATMFDAPPEVTLKPGVRPVWLSQVYIVRGVVRVPDDHYAHYTLDVHIGWIERNALAGVAG
jgi:hypothetical protein